MSAAPKAPHAPSALQRSLILSVGIAAIVLGAIALFWPTGTLATVGFVFAVFLVIWGVQRIVAAVVARRTLSLPVLIAAIVAGVVLAGAGIAVLTGVLGAGHLFATIVGVAWVVGGIVDIVLATTAPASRGPRWPGIVSGLVSVVAGLAFLIAPLVAATLLLQIGAVLLIVLGIAILLRLRNAGREARASG